MSIENDELVESVARKAPSYLDREPRSQRVLEAMRKADRADFLPADAKEWAYCDEALPIGSGQTCSQPSMVAFMLDKLTISPGMRILEVGAGSGYAARIASLLCLPGGGLIACEIRPELVLRCRANLASCHDGALVVEADGSSGYPRLAPYDRIFLSAGVELPAFDEEPFLAQLAPEGILLYPEARGSLHRVAKRRDGSLARESWHGVGFVPLRRPSPPSQAPR